MASAEPTSTASKRSRNSTDRKDARNTVASCLLWKWGLMSSQLIMLAPSTMMTAAIAGMGMMAITLARNSTIKSRNRAEAADVRRLWPPIEYTSHMRLNDAQVGREDRKGRRQLDTASAKMPLRLSV